MYLVVICVFSLLQSGKVSQSFLHFMTLVLWKIIQANYFVDCPSVCIYDVFLSLHLYRLSLTGTVQKSCVLFPASVRCYTILVCPTAGNVHGDTLNKVVSARLCDCTISLFPFIIFFFKSGYSCFTMLCQSLLYSRVNQLYIYMQVYIPHLGHHRAPS